MSRRTALRLGATEVLSAGLMLAASVLGRTAERAGQAAHLLSMSVQMERAAPGRAQTLRDRVTRGVGG